MFLVVWLSSILMFGVVGRFVPSRGPKPPKQGN
jgi:hypothetical protein